MLFEDVFERVPVIKSGILLNWMSLPIN